MCILHIHSIKSVHTCIMKNLSKNWWVPGGLEPGIMDPKSGMFAPRPILEKAINFWSGLLKFKFQAFFTKKYDNNLHDIYKKNQKKIVIKLSALLIHSCWNCSNKYWGGCDDNRALRIIGLKVPQYSWLGILVFDIFEIFQMKYWKSLWLMGLKNCQRPKFEIHKKLLARAPCTSIYLVKNKNLSYSSSLIRHLDPRT